MIGPFWYDESDPGQLLVETARRLEMNQSDRRDLYLRHACLYGDIPLLGLSPSTYARVDPTEMRVSLNVIKSVCDAFQAELSASRVKATFLTEKGKYDLRQRAQGLDRFVEGAFYESELFDIGDELLLHAPVWGNGYARIDDDPDGFRVEKHFPWEILVDDADAVRGTPRCLIYRGYEPRAVVARRHPNMKREIMGAPSVASQDSWTSWANSTTADIILVTEGWCLPTAKGAKDGVYAVALDNGKCIHKSGYEESFFPIVPMRRAKPPMGFHAMGCAENLTGLQIEVNSILLDLQDARALYARPRWFVDIRSSVQTAHLNDDIDNIVKYNSAGNKPEVYVPQVMPPEVYRQLWDLYAKAYEIEGISQLAAQAVKPAGIESGAALRSLGDTQAKRHMVAHHQVERFYLNASKCFIAAARRLAAKKPDLVVKSAQKTFFEVAKYADYALEEDQYALRVYPTSALQGKIGRASCRERVSSPV